MSFCRQQHSMTSLTRKNLHVTIKYSPTVYNAAYMRYSFVSCGAGRIKTEAVGITRLTKPVSAGNVIQTFT